MDGMAGMIPLQMFKIDPSRLPEGYKANSRNMAFIVNSESQTISANQDWVVKIAGQMCFLNTEDITGNNNVLENVIDFSTSNISHTEGTVEKISTNADLMRNVMVQYGHGENNHVGKRGPEYQSGELSSGGDITSTLKDFGIFLIKAMADPKTYGYTHNLSNQKLHFTAGNDIYHRKHPRSKHNLGKGLDFTLVGGTGNNYDKLDAVLAFLDDIKKDRYPNLYIKDEYRYPPDGERNKYTTGPHIHLQLN